MAPVSRAHRPPPPNKNGPYAIKVGVRTAQMSGLCAIRVCESSFILQKGKGFLCPTTPHCMAYFGAIFFASMGVGVVEIVFNTCSSSEKCASLFRIPIRPPTLRILIRDLVADRNPIKEFWGGGWGSKSDPESCDGVVILVGACLATGDRIFAAGSHTVSKRVLQSCACFA